MRPQGTAAELEKRRRLAVEGVEEGWTTVEVAELLGVTPRAVQRWVKAFREHGEEALAAKPRTGRPRLNAEQEAVVLGWLKRNPTEFGFGTELWTAGRITILIERNFQVQFNSHYISAWLAARGVSAQKPQRVPRERNQETIDRWVRVEWSRIKKKPVNNRPTSS